MPNPTLASIQKHPHAVVVLSYGGTGDQALRPYRRTFEWFDTQEGRREYLPAVSEWAEDDVAIMDGLLRHVVVEVVDTSGSLTLGDVLPFGGDDDWRAKVKADILAKPKSILATSRAKKIAPPKIGDGDDDGDDKPKAAAKKKGPAPKKGRKPSPAAKVIAGDDNEDGADAPAPDAAPDDAPAKAPAKKAPAKKAAAAKAPAKAADKPVARKAGLVDREVLKKRLADAAAKKRAAESKPSSESLQAFLNA